MTKTKEYIMSQIKSDKISIKARWIHLAKRIGLQSGLALTVLVVILSVNAFFFYIKSNGLLMPLHYGPTVWQKFLHSLPYDLILIIIILFLIINFIIKRFDFSYKQPIVIIFISLLLFVLLGSTVLFASNFNHALQGHLDRNDIKIPYVSDFYLHRCCQMDQCPGAFNK